MASATAIPIVNTASTARIAAPAQAGSSCSQIPPVAGPTTARATKQSTPVPASAAPARPRGVVNGAPQRCPMMSAAARTAPAWKAPPG